MLELMRQRVLIDAELWAVGWPYYLALIIVVLGVATWMRRG